MQLWTTQRIAWTAKFYRWTLRNYIMMDRISKHMKIFAWKGSYESPWYMNFITNLIHSVYNKPKPEFSKYDL